MAPTGRTGPTAGVLLPAAGCRAAECHWVPLGAAEVLRYAAECRDPRSALLGSAECSGVSRGGVERRGVLLGFASAGETCSIDHQAVTGRVWGD